MADWRNKGNWHWQEKNCYAWAKTYLETTLTKVAVSDGGMTAKVTSVDSVTGDVDLNMRKKRLLAIYDVEVKLSWEARRGDGDVLTGKITIPEVAHDTDDYVYDITATSSSAETLPLRDFVRTKLTRAIGAELEKFTDKLKEDNGKGMFIPDDEAGEATASNPQVAKEFKEGKAGSGVGVAKAKGENAAAFGTVSIKQTPEFLCSADDLFATLTDPQRVSVWTRGPAEIQPVPNTKFKLFGGHIEGEILALTPGRLIEQTWRVATWPAGHYSKVKMELEQLSNATRLTLNQTDVPLNEEDATKSNWERYYWNSIKGSFGTNLLPFTHPPYHVGPAAGGGASYIDGFSAAVNSIQPSLDAKRQKSNRIAAARKRKRRDRRTGASRSGTSAVVYAGAALSAVAVAAAAALYLKSTS